MANATISEIEAWLRRGGKSVRLNMPPKSQVKLLRLCTWSLRYYLSISEMLDLIMPVLLAQIHRQKSTHGIGVSVGLLTSDTAEKILKAEIAKRYADGEHIKIAKTQEQERQLHAEKSEELEGLPAREHFSGSIMGGDGIVDRASVDKFVAAYQQHALSKRSSYQSSLHAKWRIRKRYRWSPWL